MEVFELTLLYLIATVAILLALVWIVHSIGLRALDRVETHGQLSHGVVVPLRRIWTGVAITASVLLVLQQTGMLRDAWTVLTALLALIGIGFFAVWSVLSNTLCALIILVARPFQIGDEIELLTDNLRGEVVDFSLLFTTLRDEEGRWIQIPNNQFFQKPIRRRIGTAAVDLSERMEDDQGDQLP